MPNDEYESRLGDLVDHWSDDVYRDALSADVLGTHTGGHISRVSRGGCSRLGS